MPSSSDQRNNRRFSMTLPLTVKLDEATASTTAETKDVSSRGVFFYLETDVAEGSTIEFTLTLPPEITLTQSIKVHCQGKVVRVDHEDRGSKYGIAAAIDKYDIVSD